MNAAKIKSELRKIATILNRIPVDKLTYLEYEIARVLIKNDIMRIEENKLSIIG